MTPLQKPQIAQKPRPTRVNALIKYHEEFEELSILSGRSAQTLLNEALEQYVQCTGKVIREMAAERAGNA